MRIALIPGDGIGPEVVHAAQRCLDATGLDIEYAPAVMGQDAIKSFDTPLPAETVETVKDCDAALKGPVTTPVGSGFRSVNVALRKALDLYANVRPCRFRPGVSSRIQDPDDIDMVIVRENLEDLYSGIEFAADSAGASALTELLHANEFSPPADSAYSIKPISRHGSERVIRHAFEYAEQHGRDRVTVVDKANIMKETDGMFMHVAEQVATEYDVEHDHVLVDNMAQQLVLRPERFEVVVTQNIYGDILSDLAAGLVGGIGLIPAANIGEDAAVFATVHGTAPDIAGDGVANPCAAILSASMLLAHVGEQEHAARIEAAVNTVLSAAEETVMTPDLGGQGSTKTLTDAVLDVM